VLVLHPGVWRVLGREHSDRALDHVAEGMGHERTAWPVRNEPLAVVTGAGALARGNGVDSVSRLSTGE
jgi:hypothetical protein